MSNQEKQVNTLAENAEYQRRCRMTKEERARGAIESTAKALYEQNQKNGKNSTFEQCERHIKNVVTKDERKKSDNGRD